MFDVYHKWLGISKKHRPPTHYQLLGITADETDAEVIEEAAVRQTAHVRTYQIGAHAAECTRLLNEISQAKLTLLNPAKRKAYDEQLVKAAAEQVTAKAPAAPLRSSSFDLEDAEAPREVLPRRNLNIAKPGRSGLPVLWLAAGGGVAGLAIVVVGVIWAMRSQPPRPVPIAVAKKDKKEEPRLVVKIADDGVPNKGKPAVGKPQPEQPPDENPVGAPPPLLPEVAVVKGPEGQKPGGAPLARFQTGENRISYLSLAPDGTTIAIGNVFPRIHDLAGKEVSKFMPRKIGGELKTPVAFFPDSQRVAFAFGAESAVGIGDSATGQAMFYLPPAEKTQYASCLAVDRSGKRALVGYNYRLVYWNLEKQAEIKTWELKGIVEEVVITPDGRGALAVFEDQFNRGATVFAHFDLEQLEKKKETRRPDLRHPYSLAMAPDGQSVAVGCAKSLLMFDLPTLQSKAMAFPGSDGNHAGVAFCGQGKSVLIGGEDGLIRMLDIPALKVFEPWKGHTAAVTRIVIDTKEQIAVSGDASGTVIVWPLAAALADKMPNPRVPFPANSNPVGVNVPADQWNQLDTTGFDTSQGFVKVKQGTRCYTKQAFAGPLEITVIARTQKENIRLHAFKGGCVIFNWEDKIDELRVHRPDGDDQLSSGSLATAPVEPLAPNTWYTLRWRIAANGMQIMVNDKTVFLEPRATNLSDARKVGVGTNTSPVDVRFIEVKRLEKPLAFPP